MFELPPDSHADREQMLREHLAGRGISDTRVLQAMAKIPREMFVPPEMAHMAYDDLALSIGSGQTISQPFIVALMTQALELVGHERVLEIGTGSGYQTAILAELAEEVITLERYAHLSREAAGRLDELGYENVRFVEGDGTLGWAPRAPYDCITVTAAARQVPPKLFAQLKEGGVMAIPVGDSQSQMLLQLRRQGERMLETPLCACRFVPLVGSESPRESE